MKPAAPELLQFIDGSPSPYHAVEQAKSLLLKAGFEEVSEADRWRLEAGRGYFLARGGKSVIAWRQGRGPVADHGFRIVCAHTDSPALKLRPKPGMKARGVGYLTTEIYGSALVHTWLDRDLTIAGAIFQTDDAGALDMKLVHAPDLIVRAMSLAPHLKKEKKVDGLSIDLHKDLPVIFAEGVDDPWTALLKAAGLDPAQVQSADLFLADVQPSKLFGPKQEFISAPRLDNLFSSFAALKALIEAGDGAAHSNVAALYDAEEIGSMTWTGARSNLLEATLTRAAFSAGIDAEGFLRAKARSVLISADMAHAEHPSFPDATDPVHVPELNRGLAMKSAARGFYATGARAAAWFTSLCRKADLPLQSFLYRCDHGGGSSVGPAISSDLGVCGFDVGAPMVSMHSIRELGGARDIDYAIAAFKLAYSAAEGI